ncbi:sensor histidine kinase [Thermacetogenium phaeum DSM 12270]|uniref:histidine kinase n=1 Tax=Thermacetogenium phaeum (strain ATCC BAA-254 / DSM 26808 / PB) TaxID=1089553 RepID=K4LDM6_THEPS|nr:sensor histidine kinase [Thermacetogenium phaeum]AFV10923.1 sensor histidine kinase [Thermacetogenium phaeum DSM 12270]
MLVKADPDGYYQIQLEEDDWEILEGIAANLQLIADVSQCDVFIDCPTNDRDVAIVVAEAKPRTGKSLYKGKVSGQRAIRFNEPGVFEALEKGEPTVGTRAVSQEGVFISQNAVPIFNAKRKVIGVLIRERDISEAMKKEKQVQLLEETTELLTENLLRVAIESGTLPGALHDGLLVVNKDGIIVYVNPSALRLADVIISSEKTLQSEGNYIAETELCDIVLEKEQDGRMRVSQEYRCCEYSVGDRIVNVSWVPLFRKEFVGGIVLIRDITDVRKKEKELMVKSAVIREIHHRVKNNLQNIASILRLQMRREHNKTVREALGVCINRILSIASVHELLSQSGLETIDLHQILRMTVERIVQVENELCDCEVEICLYGDTINIPAFHASTIALVICELVQNAMRHGFRGSINSKGKIVIYTKQMGSFYELQVVDNGVGLPANFKENKDSRLGIQLVDVLVRETLKGTFQIGNNPEGGVRCSITFDVDRAGV